MPAPAASAPPSRTPRRALVAAGLLAGLGVRLLVLPFAGMDDVPHYLAWGRDANAARLAATYHGIYFPLQYQIFQLVAFVAERTGIDGVRLLRLLCFAFDAALGALLALRLRGEGRDPAGALVWWCHPYFLVISALGYIDGQFGLFVLLAGSLADRARSARGFLVAGIPLAIAFLMKPQALALYLTAAVYSVLRTLRTHDRRVFALLAPAAVLFAAYSLAFALQGRSPWFLTLSYLDVVWVMPTLSANMPNFWYPLAAWVAPGQPSYYVSDLRPVAVGLTVRTLATGLTLALLAVFAGLLARRNDGAEDGGRRHFSLLFGFAALVVPMVMTNAHENHLFLGAVFLVLFLPEMRPSTRVAVHVLLVVQALNLVGIYGLGDAEATAWVRPLMALRTQASAVGGALLASLCFLEVLAAFFGTAGGRPWARRVGLPAALVLAVASVYALVLR